MPRHTPTQESAIAEEWLEALQLAQVAFGRVLSELDEAEASLSFWEDRVKQQHHFWFIWLQQVCRVGWGGGECAPWVEAGATLAAGKPEPLPCTSPRGTPLLSIPRHRDSNHSRARKRLCTRRPKFCI